MNTSAQDWTGERLETFIFSENTNEHLHRYAMALELAAGKKVLDIACGEGYGSNLMATVADEVTGVDIDATAIENAAKKYQRDNLHFLTGAADIIPCADHSIDLIVSFETIEHHDRHEAMMLEIKRVLKPDGILIISSPDKKYYSDVPGYKNPFHVKELYKDEFENLVRKHFREAQFYAQKSFIGSLVYALNDKDGAADMKQYSGNYENLESKGMEAVYLIAIASEKQLPALHSSLFDGEHILHERMMEERNNAVQYAFTNATNAGKVAAEQAAIDATHHVQQSTSYKIGNAIIRPFAAIKRLFNA